MITLYLQSGVPIYEQLKVQINRLVLVGELAADDQLPSVRAFAKELGINPNTVQKAYQELERDGLIYSVAGKGNFISSSINLVDQLLDEEKKAFTKSVLKIKNAGVPEESAVEIVKKVYNTRGGKQ